LNTRNAAKSPSLFNIPDHLLRLLGLNGNAFSRGSRIEANDSMMKPIGKSGLSMAAHIQFALQQYDVLILRLALRVHINLYLSDLY